MLWLEVEGEAAVCGWDMSEVGEGCGVISQRYEEAAKRTPDLLL
jgi:hypothetical protein